MTIKICIIWVSVSFAVAFTDTLWKTTQGPHWRPSALGNSFYAMLRFWPFIYFGKLLEWFLMVFMGQLVGKFRLQAYLFIGKPFYRLGQLLRRLK